MWHKITCTRYKIKMSSYPISYTFPLAYFLPLPILLCVPLVFCLYFPIIFLHIINIYLKFINERICIVLVFLRLTLFHRVCSYSYFSGSDTTSFIFASGNEYSFLSHLSVDGYQVCFGNLPIVRTAEFTLKCTYPCDGLS